MIVRYYSWLRDRMGLSEEAVLLPNTVATIAEAVSWLHGRSEPPSAALGRVDLFRFALDGQLAEQEAELGSATELAIFPPITGG